MRNALARYLALGAGPMGAEITMSSGSGGGGGGGPATGVFIIVPTAYAASITFDLSPYAAYSEVVVSLAQLTGALTFNLSNGADAQKILVIVPQDSNGNRVWTSGGNLAFSADITGITLSTTGSKTDYIAFRWHAGTGKARCMAINKGF